MLVSLIKKSNKKILFTTPSHGGKMALLHKFLQWYRCDISEVDAYNPEEELKRSEEKAAKIYGTKSTHYLINGSTSGIIAAVLTCCNPGDKLLIWNNAHRSHRNAGILAGTQIIKYELKLNEGWGIYCPPEPDYIEQLLKKHSPKAIIITYPSYEGVVCDIAKISAVCKKFGTRLIVDEAHGALYPFSDMLPPTSIPYADFTVQSLHKTAGGLNPTALLHCNCELNPKDKLDLIMTTSPSYPLLASIEANINYLNSSKGRKAIKDLCERVINIKNLLKNLEFYGDDVTKILMKKQGYSGYELSKLLFDKYDIEDERTNQKSTMLLTGIGTGIKKLERLKKLKAI